MIVGGPTPVRKRGTFIVVEGVDRCGKTTQCALLLKQLVSLSVAAVAFRFPDRSTDVGQLIDGYLRCGSNLDDRAVHLLFSANRWEASSRLAQHLADGTTVVCDRYAYSGVAFSSAKTQADRMSDTTAEDLTVDWCKGPDKGLPAPDAVIFLDLSQEESERRGGYGGERYEKRELQTRVRRRFAELQRMDEGGIPWHIVDASKSIENVQIIMNDIVQRTIQTVSQNDTKPLRKMFMDGHYQLPPPLNNNDLQQSPHGGRQ